MSARVAVGCFLFEEVVARFLEIDVFDLDVIDSAGFISTTLGLGFIRRFDSG